MNSLPNPAGKEQEAPVPSRTAAAKGQHQPPQKSAAAERRPMPARQISRIIDAQQPRMTQICALRDETARAPARCKAPARGSRASRVEPTIAKVFVKASGWKSFPSCPVSAKTGHKGEDDDRHREEDGTADLLARVERMTSRSRPRSADACLLSPPLRNGGSHFPSCTMAASTSTPIAMAMPESDMMFDVMPNCLHQDERDENRDRQREA